MIRKLLIYIITESRLSICYLSPVKWRDVRRRNLHADACRVCAGHNVDRGRRWEEIKILKHCAYTRCGASYAAASFNFACVAGVRRTPATSSKPDTHSWYIYIHCSAGPQRETAVEQMACDRGRNG